MVGSAFDIGTAEVLCVPMAGVGAIPHPLQFPLTAMRATTQKEFRGFLRLTGYVKWFNDTKGFGFIRQDSDGDDIFVHYTAIQSNGHRTLEQFEQVEYDILKRPEDGRLMAINVWRSLTNERRTE